MHPCPGNWVAKRRVVVYYYAQAAHAFSAGIKCWHCNCFSWVTGVRWIHVPLLYFVIEHQFGIAGEL